MNNMRLMNLIGTGSLPPEEEKDLIARGAKFIGCYISSRGARILVTSVHEDIYARWVEQITRQSQQLCGLPSQYRIPSQKSIATSP